MNNVFSNKVQKILFLLTILITVGFLYYPKYLPMVDVPQHTALVATMDDLLKGKSPWADMLWINWDTPYIATYLIWLLLYQVMPILWATKTIIVLIFLLYVYAIILLRKTFEADKMLDWVGLTCFFGFPFQWGFVPFMLGTTVGLLFLSYNKLYLDNPNKRDWILIPLTGTIAYFSHLLAFAFFCMTAYAYFLFSSFTKCSWKQRLNFTIPYLFFALLLLHYLITPNPISSTWWKDLSPIFYDRTLGEKISAITYLPWNAWEFSDVSFKIVCLIWIIPLLGRYKLTEKKNSILLFCALLVFFLLPHRGKESVFLYQRFAPLIPVFYFLLWKLPTANIKGKNLKLAKLSSSLFIIIISSMMYKVYNNNYLFAGSSDVKEYEYIFSQTKAKKRMLNIITWNSSSDSNELTSFREHYHSAAYYQVLKQGFVDFSFFNEHAIPIRFTKNNAYSLEWKKSVQLNKRNLESKLLNCSVYDYIIIRQSDPFEKLILSKEIIIDSFSKNHKCANMKLLAETKHLLLFEKGNK